MSKPGELAGRVERHRRELDRLAHELGHLDAVIRLFDPDYRADGVPYDGDSTRHCSRLAARPERASPRAHSPRSLRPSSHLRQELGGRRRDSDANPHCRPASSGRSSGAGFLYAAGRLPIASTTAGAASAVEPAPLRVSRSE